MPFGILKLTFTLWKTVSDWLPKIAVKGNIRSTLTLSWLLPFFWILGLCGLCM